MTFKMFETKPRVDYLPYLREFSAKSRIDFACESHHRPAKLQRLVEGIASGSPIPLTVKIRIGTKASKINADKARQ